MELQQQLNKLIEEQKSSEKYSEDYKLKVSEEIKKFDVKQVKNTPITEKKYNLWERIKMALGGN
jgi:hypothetical protein